MACFFRGFNFVRNFYIPPVIRAEFGSQNEVKIYLPRIFVGNEFGRNISAPLSAVLLTFFAILTLYAAPAGSTLPTHYSATQPNNTRSFADNTPVTAAQAAASWWNSFNSINKRAIQGSCSIYSTTTGDTYYNCPFDDCTYYPTETICGTNVMVVRPMCGPQHGANWDGSEFYCPPEPGCDAPAP